ncbi:DUF3826 domain-containing protein [Gramella jeungdoensis]|uniref:DUF3826 domain-containing protein n=1 Tax=Gramella jeungdoensis TaxID=708091 RepID=A0ABT0YYE1_9FLAO|nr:DUF3826 domain-containing protein [Gramella jeungdoensis]MCM8568489.1 DUF3826 domain-containing protein [Gramella jeungdoensis]
MNNCINLKSRSLGDLKPENLLFLLVIFLGTVSFKGAIAQENNAGHQEFASSILNRMRFSESDKTTRLIKATVLYLDELEVILEQRRLSLNAIENSYNDGSKTRDSLIVKAYEIARDRYLPLKRKYVDQLEEDLTPYQVERVKDGLTHDALPNFHAMYLEIVSALKPAEKSHILALLVEGRENAMLAIDKEGQNQWWDKYRGIINNYIASQGHDFGKLSKAWDKANPEKEWVH